MIAAPHGYGEIVKFFGDPKFDGTNVDPHWESANMVSLHDLPGCPRKLYVHKLIADPLRGALTECAALGDAYPIRTIGCFAPRLKRGSTIQMSVHTFGAAVDLNADTNRLISVCELDDPRRTAPGARDIPDAWIAIFEAYGFTWGGKFRHRWDPMHLQFCDGY